uniref:CRAL-TRIO domain-containing protein n=1 Tax=Glossina pallidipes TaxID=7398 RepID=A0A1A9Z2P7_GLOPL
MDISETASLDSAGASSTENNDIERQDIEEAHIQFVRINTNHNKSIALNMQTPNILENDYDFNEINKTSLDNRIIKGDANLLADSLAAQKHHHIARTLAHKHPLMLSPTCTDSDSEFDYSNAIQNTMEHNESKKLNNYPDVVPKREYVRVQLTRHDKTETIIKCHEVPTELSSAALKQQSLKPVTGFRSNSPDLLSSESELNLSQYQATVEPNFQAVALTPSRDTILINSGVRNKNLSIAKKVGGEDISSLDSISNHSFDGEDDVEHNLASLSPSSSIIDDVADDDDDDDDDDDCEGPELLPDDDFQETITPTPGCVASVGLTINGTMNASSLELPQYTADEERKDSRNWQKITLPDGRTRDIDMRVIEPYKRVLSHGGYLKAGGHNAIVIFCACHLPDHSRTDYNYVMDNLFLYVVKTLEQLVTDDYVLIYLHGGSNRRNMPPFPWLKRCYQLLDRRLRKSLKNLYLVHPTFWIKSLIWMARPFVSNKFWRKLVYVKSLDDLSKHVTPLEKAAIPEKVKQYDAKKH